MTQLYFRPVPQSGACPPEGALTLAGGRLWFSEVECLARNAPPRRLPAAELPPDWRDALTAPRPAIAGLTFDRPRVMGILNVTPDSFSDGGRHNRPALALAAARRMVEAGADIIDVGGESTRPGALPVPEEAEIARVEPVLGALGHVLGVPVSIDTRKRRVAELAVAAGARIVNDVSGFTHEPELGPFCAEAGVAVCVMHARGDPRTMQDNPVYDDVLLDVFDFLAMQVAWLVSLGLPRERIMVDPGIGFGKTRAHNLELINRISLFHGLGCPVLLGASRKGFIRDIGQAPEPQARIGGSVAVALWAAAQGVQILRVHDVWDTAQALRLWTALEAGSDWRQPGSGRAARQGAARQGAARQGAAGQGAAAPSVPEREAQG